jgi:hypothetical protein
MLHLLCLLPDLHSAGPEPHPAALRVLLNRLANEIFRHLKMFR